MDGSPVSRSVALVFVLLVLVSSTSCAAVEGIFKAGVWVGVIVAVVVVGGALFLMRRVGR